MKRKKTRIEKWLSFNRHKRRAGVSKLAAQISDADFEAMKKALIKGEDPAYTHGSEHNINEHIANLREEFIGQTELSYYHAKLIVLIRREVNVKKNYALLEQLWNQERDFLLHELNTRWLASAADSFADYSSDILSKTFALCISSLVNSVKLCETERYINGSRFTALNAENSPVNLEKKRIGLWDGTSAFAIGTDDTLRNYRWRMESVINEAEEDCVPASILREVFLRLQQHDTVYRRFKESHHRDRTRWW